MMSLAHRRGFSTEEPRCDRVSAADQCAPVVGRIRSIMGYKLSMEYVFCSSCVVFTAHTHTHTRRANAEHKPSDLCVYRYGTSRWFVWRIKKSFTHSQVLERRKVAIRLQYCVLLLIRTHVRTYINKQRQHKRAYEQTVMCRVSRFFRMYGRRKSTHTHTHEYLGERAHNLFTVHSVSPCG